MPSEYIAHCCLKIKPFFKKIRISFIENDRYYPTNHQKLFFGYFSSHVTPRQSY